MPSDYRISYWRKGLQTQNFGDTLSELFFQALARKGWFSSQVPRARRDFDVIHLIGSVISDAHIERDLEHVRAAGLSTIAFWGCGKRDNRPLRSDLIPHCAFLGVRGPLTRDALGLPSDTPIGDPGLLVPLFHRSKRSEASAGRTICVPHFLDRLSDEELIARTGADLIVRPNIPPDDGSLTGMIDTIVSAKFVLAGALHAAIIACAFEVPFAYFDSGAIDVPFKWQDFSASINIPCNFATSIDEGWSIYERDIRPSYRRPNLVSLLECCPFRPSSDVVLRSRSIDQRSRAEFT